jgi:tol-pal system protein YbgF
MQMMKFSAPFLALLFLAGCASKSDFDSLKRDVDEMRNRQLKSDRELSVVRNESREGIDKTLKDAQKEMDGIRKVNADLQASMEGMKVDQQVLSGKVDDLSLQGKKPIDDLALFKDDIERRLAALEQKLLGVSKDQEAVQKQMSESPEILYQAGQEAFKAGDMKKARESFSRFIELYPKNVMTANAAYWVGETYYNEKNYDQAILEFQKVIKNYPDKEKVASAMLKQGMAFINLKDNKSARYILKELVKQYPSSEEAKRAKDQLKVLK